MVDYISTVSWCCMQKRGGFSRSKNLPRGINTARKFFRFRFSARIKISLQNAISTAYQGPRREKESTKNRGRKSRVRVPLSHVQTGKNLGDNVFPAPDCCLFQSSQ